MEVYLKAVESSVEKYPRADDRFIAYGTAGFRTRADDLDHVIYRMGLLVVLRSKERRATIGVVITASHNPEEDNGIKMVDPMGEMLIPSWEPHATRLANVPDSELGEAIKAVIEAENIDLSFGASIFYARDTRPSGERLCQALAHGISAAGGQGRDFGILTTPQLHYLIRCQNTACAYGEPTEEGYYKKHASAFISLRGTVLERGSYKRDVMLDAANGVGASKLRLQLDGLGNRLAVTIVNDGSGILNHKCGADYVKVLQMPPEGFKLETGVRCASFDGDADRIVYYYLDQAGIFHLMDGDKIATLIASYLQELLDACGVSLSLGLVQTAYSNGSVKNYITNQLKVPVSIVKTGMKYFHDEAAKYDMGVYFEANGHGSVMFSDKTPKVLQSIIDDASSSSEAKQAAGRLCDVMNLINQAVGDAISDFLLVEIILQARGWSIEDWNQAYTDLPSRQLKVKVKDRNVIKTTNAEQQTTAPVGLQSAIDEKVHGYTNGRCFARPSGTEDVVRIYAEADTQLNADKLATEVAMLVYDLAGGIDKIPELPN